MTTALFVQARLDSRRLPRKALLPLGDKPMVQTVMDNLSGCADTCVLVTAQTCESDFAPLAKQAGYEIFAGSKDDVLQRFMEAAHIFSPQYIIRATADNALIGPILPRKLAELCMAAGADYARFEGTPYGGGVEVIKTQALIRADQECQDAGRREHVTPYIYENPDKFKLLIEPAPKLWLAPKLSATVDTIDDYDYVSLAYKELFDGHPILLENFIQWAQTSGQIREVVKNVR